MQTTTESPPRLRGLLLRRLRDGVIVLLLVVTIIFFLAHVVGNPALVFAPVDATDEQIAEIHRQFGLDRPVAERYWEYLTGLALLDFGESTWQQRPAIDAVEEALPATIILTVVGLGVAAVLGVIPGVVAGARARKPFDKASNFLSVTALSVPNFWLGLLLILFFGVQLGWLPTSGRFQTGSIVLPAATLGIVHGGRIYQLVRSATFEEMSKPYVTVARSKGLTEWSILRRHVVRNTGVTTATIVGWEYVRMWGGAVFAIEYVFAWPGLGVLTIKAAHRQDFFVLQAAVIVAGAFVIFSNLLIDMGYQFIDRRIRAS
ncbi:MAG: ABC transporter permease [Acidimicrobiaceae bacterium]|nr:ABC transporter permease [Acidimicrobiaceae bacterium]